MNSFQQRICDIKRYLELCRETSVDHAQRGRRREYRRERAIEGATLSVCIEELGRALSGEPAGFTLSDEPESAGAVDTDAGASTE